MRTYPNLRHGRDYVFARGGERSVARGYGKALARADELVYVEDQYLWSAEVAQAFADNLRRSPGLRVVAVLPQVPDQAAALSRVPQDFGRDEALRLMQEAGGDRVAVYGLENHAGVPVYVHAKVCVMDDCWATIGSDNFNRRSWTHDSELSAVVVDAEGGDHSAYARRLRLTLAAEHLDRDVSGADLLTAMADCVSAQGMFDAFAASARRLEAWHAAGRSGPRPPGRLLPLHPARLSRAARLWAGPLYRAVHDPDGRPRTLRRRAEF